ncbi:MAG: hypothetical protein PHH48_02655 [Eubacteriales bacterium]|jgi:hypothetical protein|nr:hypothetical protein [Eubacteriales bacterium]
MTKNPIPIILVLFLLKGNRNLQMPVINTLQMEAMLDNVRGMLSTIDKINNLSQVAKDPPKLPDMEKLMELAGPVIAAMNASTPNDD